MFCGQIARNVAKMSNENLFINDPFLTLDNDLDDVSEVIRSNLFSEHPSLFDSRTPSPQYYRDTNIFMPSNMDGELIFSKNQLNYSVDSSNVSLSYKTLYIHSLRQTTLTTRRSERLFPSCKRKTCCFQVLDPRQVHSNLRTDSATLKLNRNIQRWT